MWLFWLHFDFGLVAGIEVAPTKKYLYGLYAHSMETAYGEYKSNPIKPFRKKFEFSNPIFSSIHFNESAPGAKNNATNCIFLVFENKTKIQEKPTVERRSLVDPIRNIA